MLEQITTWQEQNQQAILARLQPVAQQPDGTLFAELHGPHFVVVSKSSGRLRLWLLDVQHPGSGVVQSEMAVDEPLHLVDAYTQTALLGLLWHPAPQRIYCAGLGGGRVPQILHHHFPTARVECAEIDPLTIQVASRFFGLEFDERLRVVLEDGREWLMQQEERYDFLFVDVFLDRGYIPYRLSTAEFYHLCVERLTEQGVLVVNFLSEDKYLPSRVKTIQSVFRQVSICPLPEGNTLVFASPHVAHTHDQLIEQAKQIQSVHHFSFPFATRSLDLRFDLAAVLPQLDQATLFTDATPPEGYFDLMPSLDDMWIAPDPAVPCPCGSGRRFGECHGGQGTGDRETEDRRTGDRETGD